MCGGRHLPIRRTEIGALTDEDARFTKRGAGYSKPAGSQQTSYASKRRLAAHAASDKPAAAGAVVRLVLEGAELPAFWPRGWGIPTPRFRPGIPQSYSDLRQDWSLGSSFGAADGSKTDLVALLLSPADDASDHLPALACIARTLRVSTVRNLCVRRTVSRWAATPGLSGCEEQHWSREPSFGELHGEAGKTPLIDFCIGAPA